MSNIQFSNELPSKNSSENVKKVGNDYYIKGISDHVIRLTTRSYNNKIDTGFWRMYLLWTKDHKKILDHSRDLFLSVDGKIRLLTYDIDLAIESAIQYANEQI